MSKTVIAFGYKVLRHGLLRYRLAATSTQCIDRWWKFLKDAVPTSLEVKNGQREGLTDKLMFYVYAFVWRSNLGNKPNMTLELGKFV